MITMSDATVVRNGTDVAPLRSAMTHDVLTGFRARHDCPDGGQWIGAARPTEFEAWGDAASHEAACRHRHHGTRGVQSHSPSHTYPPAPRRREAALPKGEPCE